MGIYDRDWWRDRYNQENRSGSHKRPPVTRVAASGRPSRDGSRRALAGIVICVIVGAVYFSQRHTPTQGGPHKSTAQSSAARDRVSTWSAVAPPCNDPFPTAGTMTGNQAAWQSPNHRSETVLENSTNNNVVLSLELNGARFANIALPAASRVRMHIPMGSFEWRVVTGKGWCGRSWSFAEPRITRVSGALDIVPGRRLSVQLSPKGETFEIRLRTQSSS
jgi:hypothetical protein